MKGKPGTGKYDRLLARCKSLAPIPTAVAFPCEESALAGARAQSGKSVDSNLGFTALDGLVFTAGIGENSAEVRRRIAEACAWLGVELDPEANDVRGPRISRGGSRVSAWVIPTNEELMIARHTGALLGLSGGSEANAMHGGTA
jgi:hypothetical protein